MLFESPADFAFATAVSRLAYCNPFLPERIECERDVLGDQFVETDAVWSVASDWDGDRANISVIEKRADGLVESIRRRLVDGIAASEDELRLYENLAAYRLFYRVHKFLENVTSGKIAKPQLEIAAQFEVFQKEARHLLNIPGVTLPIAYEPAHLFAIFFQVRRAFHHIFSNIVGTSMFAAKLRASIWQSLFTHDMARYWRLLYDRMNDLTTLITGPSGTGKELVASAIAQSRYIPFDPKTKSFTGDFKEQFHPLNLSAMSPTLIESEMFGHRRGAFTGALEDRAGWMEVCSPLGTVFLDEIGELDPAIQVKLLRVLQTRQFQRLGDTKTRAFRGKIIAATNRDLATEMSDGKFRKDFFYRICSDIIQTPSLQEQLAQSPGDLNRMILFITTGIAGEEAEELADEVSQWIGKHLGSNSSWPGNFRELEQCVRNVLIRREYHPQHLAKNEAGGELADDLLAGELTADELLRRYCTLVYSRTRNLEETARRLKLDRRTVKAKVDPEVLREAKGP
jgi:transcriptional regulator with AAA-type ATPase domain